MHVINNINVKTIRKVFLIPYLGLNNNNDHIPTKKGKLNQPVLEPLPIERKMPDKNPKKHNPREIKLNFSQYCDKPSRMVNEKRSV